MEDKCKNCPIYISLRDNLIEECDSVFDVPSILEDRLKECLRSCK